ncbi:MAG: sigma-70 family RNA polymerase sigma factor [Elusimicrobiales bacterium]|nr:sigma-70 family RNA polymerase sigma factor [Elusimicrobiales bacterium]MCK5582526.1 sigma-70 family RNA polymerase sigma factor [Elusimicrobiales bacterium]
MTVTDAELIKAYKKGDTQALEKIMEKYKTPIYSYLLKMVGNRDSANDLFQEIFLKFIKNIQSYNEEKKFANWIYTVAHNTVMDSFRKNKNRYIESLDQIKGEDFKSVAETIASKDLSPENILIKTEISGKIEKAFEILSDEQREVFIMRHYWGLSFKEIAEILKVPIGTALARMSRALGKLKVELGHIEEAV